MVDQGGKAQQAGLKLGDWIVELDDQLLTRWYVHVRRVACTCVQTLRAPPTKIKKYFLLKKKKRACIVLY